MALDTAAAAPPRCAPKRRPRPCKTETARIVRALRDAFPGVVVVHLGGETYRESGAWYFKFDAPPRKEVRLESRTGGYPFLITADDPDEVLTVRSFDEAILVIGKYLDFFRTGV